MHSETIIRSLKITLGAILAISLAGLPGLKYSATAGIITILSIQVTKRETLQTALGRTLAFFCALLLSAACYRIFGFTVAAFGIYLLIFSSVCLAAGWTSAIAMDSVLITHFLAEQSMSPALLLNEVLLFAIGTATGILLNLHLRPRQKPWQEHMEEADEAIRAVLSRMAVRVRSFDKSDYSDSCFSPLEQQLADARKIALTNIDNTLLSPSYYELDYVEMRQKQCEVLRRLYQSIRMMAYLPRQAETVASFFDRISRKYQMENDASALLAELNELLLSMKKEPLPENREEFESRAVLFYILKQLEEFLLLKKKFSDQYGLK